MQKSKALLIGLFLAILLIPITMYIRKFNRLEALERHKVKFDPITCYECKDCPCEFTLDDNKVYLLNKYDKTVCKIGYKEINKGIEKGLTSMTVELSVSEYMTFSD